MAKVANSISTTLKDPVKYIVAPFIYFIYSSTLLLYGYLIRPWMVSMAVYYKLVKKVLKKCK